MKTLITALILACSSCVFSQDLTLQTIRSINPTNTDYSDLAGLKTAIGNAQMVLLGEPSHNYGNVFEAKTRVVQYLHQELGFEILAFESGFYDQKKTNDDIAAGKDVKAALASSIFSIWTQTNEFQPLMNYIEQHKKTINLVGFDSRFSGEYVFETLHDDLMDLVKLGKKEKTKKNSDVTLEGILEYWEDVVENMAGAYALPPEFNATVFNIAHNKIKNAITPVDGTMNDKAEFMLRVMDNIEKMVDDYHTNKTSEKIKETWRAKDNNVRDRLMAENLIYWAKKFPHKKIMVWAATAHLANAVSELEHEELKEFAPMGFHLKKALGNEQVYCLAFTGLDTNTAFANTPKTIEYQWLSGNDSIGFVDVKTNPSVYYSNAIGPIEEPINGIWSKVVDGWFFVGKFKKSTPYTIEFVSEPDLVAEELEKELKNPVRTSPNVALTSTSVYRANLSENPGILTVSGQVTDASTKQGIPYVNLGISRTYTGTSSNTDGYYVLKLQPGNLKDSVRISYLGFEPKCVSVTDLMKQKNISLKPVGLGIKEVVISAKRPTALEIMKKAINAIPTNYNQHGFTQTRYSRIYIYNDRDTIYGMLDQCYDDYDKDGFQKVPLFPIRYQGFLEFKKGRWLRTDSTFRPITNYKNTQTYKPTGSGYSDFIDKRNNNFLNKSLLQKYRFQYNGVRNENGNQFYVITFECKQPRLRNSTILYAVNFNGEIHINTSDYAILGIESTAIKSKEDAIHVLNKLVPNYKTGKDLNDVWFSKENCYYKKVGNYYYLDRIISKDTFDDYDFEIYGGKITEGERARQHGTYKIEVNQPYKAEDWQDFSIQENP